jgi:hypothetical protein
MRHYERLAGRELSVERVMAWHIRQAFGDVLWRSEAGLPLPDHRAPADWVADMAARFRYLGELPLSRLRAGGPRCAPAQPDRARRGTHRLPRPR